MNNTDALLATITKIAQTDNARILAQANVRDLTRALGWFLKDERFQVAVGGNPIAVEKMLSQARAILDRAEQSQSEAA